MNDLGSWISNGTAAPFYARRQFEIKKEVKKATAKVCGLGQFHFYMNGKKIGDHELDPGWTNYRKLIQYVTFDVTSALHTGENVMGAEVGNGWFIKMDEGYTFQLPKFMPPNPNPYRPFGKQLVLALELEILYRDGTAEKIRADHLFRVKEHPVVMSNVYGSEIIDGRLEEKGWNQAGFDDSQWKWAVVLNASESPAGELTEQFQPPVKVIGTYEGKLLHQTANREIYDFGQNMSGILELKLYGKTGDTVKIYPAEKLGANGDVDQIAKDWTEVDSCITCILGCDDQWQDFRMKFTYFAGRYVAVERCSGDKDAPRLCDLRAHAVTSAWKTDGSFTCDDKRYEQIYSLVEKAVEANMVSVHTDCPTIERFAWQEPNHLMAPSIMYMKDGRKLWEKFLLDMRTDQHKAEDFFYDFEGNRLYPGEGMMPSQCPCYIPNVIPVPEMGSFYDIIAWGSTCILGTWWHYQFYGDEQIIRDNYEAGMRYLAHLKRKVNQDGFINHGLGDWGNPEKHYVRENVETAFLYADTVTLERFAKILGKQEDAEALHAYAEEIRKNYNEKLLILHPEKGYWCYRAWDAKDEILLTQTCQALPLYWGMVPDDRIADVVRAFRDTLDEKQAFAAGEIGLPYVIQTARQYHMNDRIARFILRETHPSYYAFVLDGETTLGEYWETNPRSHCHDMMGHIIEWYYNGIAGILPEKPGFAKIKICPFLPESMKEFHCVYDSAKGMIGVHVKEQETEIMVEITVPRGVECRADMTNLEENGKKTSVVFL